MNAKTPAANSEPKQDALAVRVARLYYYQSMNTSEIADELSVSRSTVSRLLTWARDNGLVEIHIHDPSDHASNIETRLREQFGLPVAKVVAVPARSTETDWHERVTTYAAGYLNTVIKANMVVGLAWGRTLHDVSKRLTPKPVTNVDIVALNGSGTTEAIASTFSGEIVSRFAANYGGVPHYFPVPAFFDFAETKKTLWRERSVKRLLELQQRADVLIYSLGAVSAVVPSHVYNGGFLEPGDQRSLRRDGVVGDIATQFYRADGSYTGVELNARASGPDLALLRRVKHSICIASGTAKVEGLRGALAGRLINALIVDEPTGLRLLQDQPTAKKRVSP